MFGIFLQAAKLYTSKQAHEVYVIVTHHERAAINSGSIIKELGGGGINSIHVFCETTVYFITF